MMKDEKQKKKRLKVMEDMTTKPDPIVMCTEYEDRPAVVKCEQCKDFFSREGFAQTHLTGKRKSDGKVFYLAVSLAI